MKKNDKNMSFWRPYWIYANEVDLQMDLKWFSSLFPVYPPSFVIFLNQ